MFQVYMFTHSVHNSIVGDLCLRNFVKLMRYLLYIKRYLLIKINRCVFAEKLK